MNNMNNIWFISDWHFCHNKNFIWQSRGFSSIEEMNETIIERHNNLVSCDDIVYVLGDCMLGDLQSGLNCIKRLKGKMYLAYGNHCTEARIKAFHITNLFEDIQMGYRIKGPGKRSFIATHYPTITANGNDTKVFGLYGHTHQTTNFYNDGNKIYPYLYHVGVDSHNCTPVNIEDVVIDIKKEIDKYK